MGKITLEELNAQHEVYCADPKRYVEMMTGLIDSDPDNPGHYYGRHQGWLRLERPDLAMLDLNQSIALEPHVVSYLSRGSILAQSGRHQEALTDYARAKSLDAERWIGNWGPLHQAISLAELGEEEAAVASCAMLSDSHWTPGFDDIPGGNKAEVTDHIRRRAREVAGRLRNNGPPSSRTE